MDLDSSFKASMVEIYDEIDSALKDSRGLKIHQKRLAFCISLGTTELLELYLKKKNILKEGYKLNHQWFKKKKENVKKILQDKVTSSLDNFPLIDKILDVCYNVESKRNELAYGNKNQETLLSDLISDFLDINKEVENE